MKRTLIATLIAAAVVCDGATYKDMLAAYWAKSGSPSASVIGGAVDLDGSSEYFSDSSATLLAGATSITVIAWVKVDAGTGLQGVVTEQNSGDDLNGVLTSMAQKQYLFVVQGNNRAGYVYSRSNSVTTGVWQQVVGVWTGGTPVIYVNASPQSASPLSCTIPAKQSAAFRLGMYDSGAGLLLDGQMDDSAIFKNRALGSNEVAELYNAGAGKPITSLSTGTNGLVRYWKLDDGLSNSSATQALDTVSGTYAIGTAIGSGDWTNGIVPQ